MSKFHWILDPGHGGRDFTRGKRSPVWPNGSQYFEGEGNRLVLKAVSVELKNLIIDHSFTVHPDNLYDKPLKDRTDYERSFNIPTITVSSHSDGFKKPSAHGWTVYTSKGRTKSDDVATRFYLEAKAMFPEEKFRMDMDDGDPDKEADFWMLRKTKGMAILLENFFHTNPRECQEILMTEEGRAKIVKYIVNAIVYIEENGI